MENNPILKDIKVGDICLIGHNATFYILAEPNPAHYQIILMKEIKFIPAGMLYDDVVMDIDWLDFKAELLYTMDRMHPSILNNEYNGVAYNCRAILEIIPQGLVSNYVNKYNMFPATKYMLSDNEFELQKNNILKHIKVED